MTDPINIIFIMLVLTLAVAAIISAGDRSNLACGDPAGTG